MATEKVTLDIDIKAAGNGAKTLGQLKAEFAALNAEIEQVPIGSAAFNKLQGEIAGAGREVKNLELGMQSLDNEALAGEMGKFAGAVGGVSSAFVLLGGESDNMQKVAKNIQLAMGVSMGLKGAVEGITSASKLYNNVTKSQTLLTFLQTKAQAALNFVMSMNPIGLIVIAVAALIGGFILLGGKIKEIKDGFISLGAKVSTFLEGLGAMKYVVLALLGPIGLVIAAWDFFFGEQAKQMDAQAKREEEERLKRAEAVKELKSQHNERLKQIEEIRKAEQEAFQRKKTADELQIARDEALGKSSFTLKKQVLQDIIDEEKAVLASNTEKIDSWIKYYTDLAALRGQSEEDFIATMKGQGVDLEALRDKALANQLEQEQKIFQAETNLLKLEFDQAKKNNDAKQKLRDEDLKAEEKAKADALKLLEQEIKDREALFARRVSAQKELDAIEIQNIKDADERRRAEAIAAFEADIELLDENIEEENALIIAKQQLLMDELALIDEEAAAREKELAETLAAEKKAAQEEELQQAFDNAEKVIGIAENLNTLLSSKELKRIAAKQKAGEALTKKEIQQLKNEEKRQKAFALAQIASDTARGISGAVAAGAGLPFPANIPAILAGISAVLAGAVQAQTVLGESSSIDFGTASGGAGGVDLSTEETGQPNIRQIESGSTLLNQEPTQVYVVESDITNTQNSVNAIVQQATF